jgi:hypothetical protein
MKGTAEADVRELITDSLVHKITYCCRNFRRRDRHCANVTNRWNGEYSHRASILFPYSFSKKCSTFDWSRHRNLIVTVEVGVRLIKISKCEN